MNDCWLKDERIEVNDGMTRVLDEVKKGVFYCKMPETKKRLRSEEEDPKSDKDHPNPKEQVKLIKNTEVDSR